MAWPWRGQTLAWPWPGRGLVMAWPWLGHGLAMEWEHRVKFGKSSALMHVEPELNARVGIHWKQFTHYGAL